MRIKINKFIIIFIVLILSMGAVSASHDIDDNLSSDSLSISNMDGAVFNNLDSTNVKDANSNIASNSSILGSAMDYKDGSSEGKKNILGSYDEENDYDGQVIYVDLNYDGDGSQDNPYHDIERALDNINEDNAVINIKPGVYTGSSNIGQEINSDYEGLLIKADGGQVILDCENNIEFFFDIQRYNVCFSGITFINKGNPDESGFKFSDGACVKFINCTFKNIEASDYPFISIFSGGSFTFKDCNFIENTGGYGACIYSESSGASIVIENCNFTDNYGFWDGGAIYLWDNYETLIKDCTFTSNHADYDAGAIYCTVWSVTVEGCTFSDNTAGSKGGAISLGEWADCIIKDNTFDNNEASDVGDAIFNKGTISEFSNNAISDGATKSAICLRDDGSINDLYVVLANNQTVTTDSSSSVDVDVRVTDDMENIISGRNVVVYSDNEEIGSVTAGDDSKISIPYRHLGKTIISGTYEGANNCIVKTGTVIFQYTGPIYVSTDGSDDNSGSIDSPLRTVEKAISLATRSNNEHSIIINEGTYYENSLEIPNCPLNIAGLGSVIINAEQNKILKVNNGLTTISNITFKNSRGSSESKAFEFIYGSEIKFENCTFKDIKMSDDSLFSIDNGRQFTFTDCTFVDNEGLNGGCFNINDRWPYVTIQNCTFINNTASSNGGAIYIKTITNNGDIIIIDDCTFINNTAINGGAIYHDGSSSYRGASITNNEFDSNSATNAGGSVYNKASTTIFSNNIITNSNAETGKSIYNEGKLSSAVVILANNSTVIAPSSQAVEISVVVTDDMGNVISGRNVRVFYDGAEVDTLTASEDLKISISPRHGGDAIISGEYFGAGTSSSKNAIIRFPSIYLGPIYVSTEGSDDNNGSVDSPLSSIKKAIEFAMRDGNERSIIINEGTYHEKTLEIPASYGLNITGLGSVTINGNQSRILLIMGDNSNISNIRFVNGSNLGQYDASVVIDAENVTLDKCTFINNTGIRGGALHISGKNATVNDCDFINNSGTNGGAIYVSMANSTVSNCRFADNKASQNGGSIYNDGINTTLTNNNIVGSNASEGKKIYNQGSFKDYIITVMNNSTATCPSYNTVEGIFSGSISVPITVTDDAGNEISGNYINILNNGETILSDTFLSEGFASVSINPHRGRNIISVDYPGSGKVYTATINANANPYTGIIYVHPDGNDNYPGTFHSCVKSLEVALQLASASTNQAHEIWLRGGEHNISNVRITVPINIHGLENDEEYGDVIVNGNNNAILEILADNVNITNIKFINSSSAINIRADNAHIIDSKFDNASIVTDYGVDNTLIDKCSFSNGDHNIFRSYDGNLTIINSNFTNMSSGQGGALLIHSPNTLIDNCIFENCSSSTSGGAIYGSGENSVISNSQFINTNANTAGALDWSSNTNGLIENCTFINVSSMGNGGAIIDESKDTTINNCNFTNVSAQGKYGAMELRGINPTISNSSFNNVHSDSDVGAIYLTSKNPGGTIANCTFDNVSAGGYAGAIYADRKNVVITNCSFTDTSADEHAGAILIGFNSKNSEVENCSFINSHANTDGGAIWINGEDTAINDCNFTATSADGDGGAVHVNAFNTNITDCVFTDISADGDGGAVMIMMEGSYSNIENCNFSNVRAHSGAAIFMHANNVTAENINVQGANSIEYGAIAVEDTYHQHTYNVTLNNINITDSLCTELGGGLYWAGNNGVINNTVITNSKSFLGGGIYLKGNNVTIENTAVSYNQANIGGGIFMIGSDNALINSNVTFNHATDDVGGVSYLYDFTNSSTNISKNTPNNLSKNNYKEEPYSNNSSVVLSLDYQSYLIPLSDGSIGFCINPFRMRAAEGDVFIVYKFKNEPVRKLRSLRGSADDYNETLITNFYDHSDVSWYLKYLFYEYGDKLDYDQLHEAYILFIQGTDYRTSTNQLVQTIIHKVDVEGIRVPYTNAKKVIIFQNGTKVLREFNFTVLINTNSTGQNLLSLIFTDVPFVNISVNKVWNDSNNQDGVRPSEVTVQLLADYGDGRGFVPVDGVNPVTLSAANNWKYTFTDLPTNTTSNLAINYTGMESEEMREMLSSIMQKAKYGNGTLINYTISEISVDNYITAIANSTRYNFTVTNVEVTSLNVTKLWNDSNNKNGLRPGSVTVHLFADGVLNQTVVLDESNGWTWNFTNLTVYKNGKKIKYNVSEDSIGNYITEYSNNTEYNFTITNIEVTSVNVTKVWNDSNNKNGLRPSSITVYLFADGVLNQTVVLDESNGWSYNFTNLHVYKNGEKIKYSFTEDSIDYYITEYSNNTEYNFTITNIEVTSVNVTKVWNDGNNKNGLRPSSITVHLFADGVLNQTVILDESNGWSWNFT
ncbi:Cna B-type domain-containing protein, partial [Methanobrevibacter sp.]|uniref:Cna B-type domain-containing protein n=1 Tax=Methanobrevibacter sp. TaxID=66852 RepID=UPI00388E37C8